VLVARFAFQACSFNHSDTLRFDISLRAAAKRLSQPGISARCLHENEKNPPHVRRTRQLMASDATLARAVFGVTDVGNLLRRQHRPAASIHEEPGSR
jgi:hypothetical protein